jgi:hypothetical protein
VVLERAALLLRVDCYIRNCGRPLANLSVSRFLIDCEIQSQWPFASTLVNQVSRAKMISQKIGRET